MIPGMSDESKASTLKFWFDFSFLEASSRKSIDQVQPQKLSSLFPMTFSFRGLGSAPFL